MKLIRSIAAVAAAGTALFLSFNAQAQGLYAMVNGGYNVGIGSQYGERVVFTNTIDPATNAWRHHTKAERVRVNFGKGFTGNAGVGYMFTEQLGIEMQIGYLAGAKNYVSFQNIFHPDPDRYAEINTTMHAQMVLFQPSLVMVTRLSDNLNLQGRFGLVTGTGSVFSASDHTYSIGGAKREAEYYGGWSFGLQGGLGLHYKISQKYTAFSEVQMSNLSYAPTKLYVRAQNHNGQNDLEPAYVQAISLENDYTTVDLSNQKGLKQPFNFSTAGLRLGVKYNF